MLDIDRIEALRRLAPPVLSAYIDTNPATRRNQGHPPGYLAWLKTAARRLERQVAAEQQRTFREKVQRLERELQDRSARARGIAAFVGPRTREFLRLQVAVDDELHWGPPALKQLFWHSMSIALPGSSSRAGRKPGSSVSGWAERKLVLVDLFNPG
jgi:hypothetical protein